MGFGVDNILEVDIITPNGTFITANATSNSDLWWALRGGGGGNWGIITAVTYRAHSPPKNGVTYVDM
jgi:FAD/FMN-containing dehydrogenase